MTLRWGIVTAGKISHDFVNAFNSYSDVGEQTIVGIAARDKDRAAEFAKLHNIQHVFDSYQALAVSDTIDVAYIGALNPDHFLLTKLFLENGKHVLCEKPLCLNYKQADTLVNLAKEKKLFLMEAIWSRFSPAYIDLEKDITGGKLGDIKFIEGNFGVKMNVERIFKKEYGGSAVLDIGIYLLHLAQYVFKQEPKNITVVGSLYIYTGVDDAETIILDYGGGKRAVLNTHSTLQLLNRATVYGTEGLVTLEEPFHFPDKVTVNGVVKEYPLHTSKVPYNFVNSAGLVYEALEVAKCIKAGLVESPRLPHKETLTFAKIMDTVRKQLGVHYSVDD